MGEDTGGMALTRALLKRRRKMAAELLQYRYDIGKSAITLSRKRESTTSRRYGSQIVAAIALELTEGLSTIYACMRFVREVSDLELVDFKAKAWPWRGIVALFYIDDLAARKKLKARYEAGEFKTTDEFRTAAQCITRKLRRERRHT